MKRLLVVLMILAAISPPAMAEEDGPNPNQVALRFVKAWAEGDINTMRRYTFAGENKDWPDDLPSDIPIKPGHVTCEPVNNEVRCDFISRGQHMTIWLERVGKSWLVRGAGANPATPQDREPIYCVREGGFPNSGSTESDFPDCIWVDVLEDVPAGSTCIPSGCDSVYPENARRFWCLDYSGDDLPAPANIPPKCLRFFAEKYGEPYVLASKGGGQTEERRGKPQQIAPTDPITLELPALRITLNP